MRRDLLAERKGAARPALLAAVAAALVLLLVGVFALLAGNSPSDQPVSAGWEGDRLVALNARGKVCRVIERETRRPEPIVPVTADGKGARLAVHDLNGDGRNEIVAVYGSSERANDRLAAFDRGGRPLWDLSASAYGFPEGRGVAGLEWFAFYFAVREGEGSVPVLAIRRARRASFSVVDWIDGATGRSLGTRVHEGEIEGAFAIARSGGEPPFALAGTFPHARTAALLAIVRAPRSLLGKDAPGGEWREEPRPLADPADLGGFLLAAARLPGSMLFVAVYRELPIIGEELGDDPAPARVLAVSEGSPGRMVVDVAGGGEGSAEDRAVRYEIVRNEEERFALVGVDFSGGFRSALHRRRAHLDDTELDALMEEEAGRLADSAETLTPGGWVPIPRAAR